MKNHAHKLNLPWLNVETVYAFNLKCIAMENMTIIMDNNYGDAESNR